ncbi:zinc ribbon domain-containing protein [Butyrivibrio fibrisolvens]|uniref:zinc ribbon domain-containing protein n=1 Tax=Butyrivibrio fibrisolvens TaxID=831 RepID=UPI0004171DC4|nr:zinc ribbon domain-containing protein [Butyrivibrio fibrisolvens]
MYKIICPECKNEVDSTNKSCPNCGYPFKEKESKNLYKILSIIEAAIIAALIVALVLIGIPKTNKDSRELDEGKQEANITSDDIEEVEVENDLKDDSSTEFSITESKDDEEQIVDDNEKGSKNNPYSLGEKISIQKASYSYFGTYDESDVNLVLNTYSEENNLISVSVEIMNSSTNGTIYPFGSSYTSGLIVQYVDSNYSLLGYANETTDKSDLELFSNNNLGMFDGGQGETYLYSYDDDEWNNAAEYVVIIAVDKDTKESSYYWVKLH